MVEFRLLDGVRVLAADGERPVGGPMPKALLALLCVSRRPLSKARLVAELWGEHPPPTVDSALRVHLSAVRRAVGDLLVATPAGYRLSQGDDQSDLARYEAACARGDLVRARSLLQAEPFEGAHPTELLDAERVRLHELGASALNRWANAELIAGRHLDVVDQLVQECLRRPTDELLAASTMVALHRAGRRGEALELFGRVRDRLASELSATPGPVLSGLAVGVAHADPTLDWLPLDGLPVPATPHLGRRAELRRSIEILQGCRLMTVVGPPGVGKTRFAIELARRAGPLHTESCVYLPLGRLRDGTQVLEELAVALDVRASPGLSLGRAVAAALSHGRRLVVLDNCEHLRDVVAETVEQILAATNAVRVLCTSRRPLGLGAEHVVTLAGLSLPRDEGRAAAQASDAVRLLDIRVAAARGGRALGEAELGAAARICRNLDGLPLALEVAAAQCRTSTVAEVAEELPERDASMAATLEWSYLLLDAEQQQLVRRFSVFSGAVPASLVSAVTGDDAHPPATLRRLLHELCEHSMIVPDTGGAVTRFRMLGVVRGWARGLLDPDERDELEGRRAAALEELAQRHRPALERYDADALREVGALRDDLRSCIVHLTRADPGRALSLATTTWWSWLTEGLSAEGRSLLEPALAAAPDAPLETVARARRAAGALARQMGDLGVARRHGELALVAAQRLGEPGLLLRSLNSLGLTLTALNELEGARERLAASVELAEELDLRPALADGLNNLAVVLRGLGDYARSGQLLERSGELAEQLGAERLAAAVLSNRSQLARLTGDPATALDLALRSFDTYTRLGFLDGQLDAGEAVAMAWVGLGRHVDGLVVLECTGRQRELGSIYTFVQDEVVMRESAEALARAALTSEDQRACRQRGRDTGLAELVGRIRGQAEEVAAG